MICERMRRGLKCAANEALFPCKEDVGESGTGGGETTGRTTLVLVLPLLKLERELEAVLTVTLGRWLAMVFDDFVFVRSIELRLRTIYDVLGLRSADSIFSLTKAEAGPKGVEDDRGGEKTTRRGERCM
mmetsp:Transcript_25607/g.54083  ORF Transcript_25607/g.54083 Transcript_25607/m.54083 type:complete len:129 (+) Transcript_25607:109-495(+)